jgi:hypothetical protein
VARCVTSPASGCRSCCRGSGFGAGRRAVAITSANARGKLDPREGAVVWEVASGKELVRVPQRRNGKFAALGRALLAPFGEMHTLFFRVLERG